MSRANLVLTAIAAIVLGGLPAAVRAADLNPPEPVMEAPAVSPAECGPCGCLEVSYEYHRELMSTYGTGFDPRNYDQTRPYYYFGARRAYPRFHVAGATATGPCAGDRWR